MSKILADQIQKPGGTTFTLPSSNGISGQYLKTDGSGNLSYGQPVQTPPGITGLVAPEGKGIVGSISSHSDRGNIYSTGEWSSSGPWTTYYNYSPHSDNSAIQFMQMALGDGFGADGSSNYVQGNDTEHGLSRRLMFANGNRLGVYRDKFYYDNDTSWGGIGMQIMPIRNTSSSSISINLYSYTSDYWSSGYEGTTLFVFAPNTSTYSTCTSVSSTRVSYTQTNTYLQGLSGSYSVPGNTTVLVCLTSSDYYWTTYRFKDTNYFYNLNTTFSNSSIICDMRMLSALYASRFNMTYAGAFSSILPKIWTQCAVDYGDR